jgi:glyoxylase-like metal-dependent hydrolase (beta-lactamase superfamily II)
VTAAGVRETARVFEPVGPGVYAVDTETVRPLADASYLIVESGHAAFVDTGTHHSVPNLLRALGELDLDAGRVDYILLTHVHLDHAGGAGRLTAALPRARVVVHPRGAAHLVEPERLVAATKAVYGGAAFAAQFGDVLPVEAGRVKTVGDGERLAFGSRTLEFLHTPGHALHHVCIADRESREVFTGDTFGISYREADTAAGEFIFPTTTPAQFDPDQLHASISRVAALEPRAAYLTHYGRVGRIGELAQHLHADIDAFVRIAREAGGDNDRGGVPVAGGKAPDKDRTARMEQAMYRHLCERLDAHGFTADEAKRHALLDGDVALNCAGLESWLARVS